MNNVSPPFINEVNPNFDFKNKIPEKSISYPSSVDQASHQLSPSLSMAPYIQHRAWAACM